MQNEYDMSVSFCLLDGKKTKHEAFCAHLICLCQLSSAIDIPCNDTLLKLGTHIL